MFFCCGKSTVQANVKSGESEPQFAAEQSKMSENIICCYLIYEPVDSGTMKMIYRAKEPKNYLAKAFGGKPYPKWKQQANGDVKIKTNVHSQQEFYKACLRYVTECYRNDDNIILCLDKAGEYLPYSLGIVLHFPMNNIVRFTYGAIEQLQKADAVVCCHPDADQYYSPTMSKDLFLSSAGNMYAAAELQK